MKVMDVKPIRTEKDYARALKEVEKHWSTKFSARSPDGQRYEVLLALVEAYERERFVIANPDPIAAIKIRMEDLGLQNRDLLPIFGTRSRIHEVLNKVRGLSVEHIREIHKRLEIPAEVLLTKYRLRSPASAARGKQRKSGRRAA